MNSINYLKACSKNYLSFEIWAHLRRKTPQNELSAPIPRICLCKSCGIPGAHERPLQSHTYRKATVFGRISATIPCALRVFPDIEQVLNTKKPGRMIPHGFFWLFPISSLAL
jgi:hypothetical protein